MVSENRARLAHMYAIQSESDDPVERALGIVCDRTEVRRIDGVNHYIGDAVDADGTAMFRSVAVENCPLFPAPEAANLAWEFLSRFSRREDGSLRVQ